MTKTERTTEITLPRAASIDELFELLPYVRASGKVLTMDEWVKQHSGDAVRVISGTSFGTAYDPRDKTQGFTRRYQRQTSGVEEATREYLVKHGVSILGSEHIVVPLSCACGDCISGGTIRSEMYGWSREAYMSVPVTEKMGATTMLDSTDPTGKKIAVVFSLEASLLDGSSYVSHSDSPSIPHSYGLVDIAMFAGVAPTSAPEDVEAAECYRRSFVERFGSDAQIVIATYPSPEYFG